MTTYGVLSVSLPKKNSTAAGKQETNKTAAEKTRERIAQLGEEKRIGLGHSGFLSHTIQPACLVPALTPLSTSPRGPAPISFFGQESSRSNDVPPEVQPLKPLTFENSVGHHFRGVRDPP